MLFNNLLVFARGRDRESRQIVELQLPLEAVWVDDLRDLDPLGGTLQHYLTLIIHHVHVTYTFRSHVYQMMVTWQS